MVKTKQVSTEATEDELIALLRRSGKQTAKEALNDAMQYYITHAEE